MDLDIFKKNVLAKHTGPRITYHFPLGIKTVDKNRLSQITFLQLESMSPIQGTSQGILITTCERSLLQEITIPGK